MTQLVHGAWWPRTIHLHSCGFPPYGMISHCIAQPGRRGHVGHESSSPACLHASGTELFVSFRFCSCVHLVKVPSRKCEDGCFGRLMISHCCYKEKIPSEPRYSRWCAEYIRCDNSLSLEAMISAWQRSDPTRLCHACCLHESEEDWSLHARHVPRCPEI